jgi:hypothetical protein
MTTMTTNAAAWTLAITNTNQESMDRWWRAGMAGTMRG